MATRVSRPFVRTLLVAVAAGGLVLAPAAVASAGPSGIAATAVPTAADRAAAISTSYRSTVAAGRALAAALVKESGASSISLALNDNGRVVWRETFGAVDTKGTKPLPTTVYGIGSVSKTVTAVAVMQLVDAGLVRLDEPVTSYVKDFTMADPAYRQITVRMLLNHSAGFPGSYYPNGISTAPYPAYAEDALRSLRTQRLKTTPGSMSVYCNDCFTLAGILVERVSGLSFQNYLQERIFRPLGMSRSGVVTTLPTPEPFAPVLAPDGSGPLPQEVTNILASGGIYSTPTDMSRLATMFMNGGSLGGTRLLSAGSVALMGSNQTRTTLDVATAPWFLYGLGWDHVAEPGLAAVGVPAWVKGGDTTDYHAGFTVAPHAKLAVTVLAAGRTIGSSALETLGQEILLHALVDQRKLAAVPSPVKGTTLPVRRPTAAQLAAITGTYASGMLVARVEAQPDGSLRTARLDAGRWVTKPDSYTLRTDGRFWTSGDPGSSIRVVGGWGRHYLVMSTPSGAGHYRVDMVLGQRLTPGTTLPAWRDRVGKPFLLVSEQAASLAWNGPLTTLQEIPGLPGYLRMTFGGGIVDAGTSDTFAPMFLVVPTMAGRDQGDLTVLDRTGEQWLTAAGYVMRPLSGVPALAAGANPLRIGPEGYAEWVTVPTAGRIAITGASAWKLYPEDDSAPVTGSGDASGVDAQAGSMLVVFGAPGTTPVVTLG